MADASVLFTRPTPGLVRDPCTCRFVRPGTKHPARTEPLCPVCAAWDHERVLVEGDPRYLRTLWIVANLARVEEG